MITIEVKDGRIIVSDENRIQDSPLTKGIGENEQYMVSLAAFLGYEPLELLNLDLDEDKIAKMNICTEEQDFSKYDALSLEELCKEKEELLGAISNERLFQKGCSDFDNIWMHEYNISALLQELEYVEERIKAFSVERHKGMEETTNTSLESKIQSASGRAVKSQFTTQGKEQILDLC